MRRELHIFLTAVMFYTRLPVAGWVSHEPELLNLATRYVSVIGWIVGVVYSTVIAVSLIMFPPVVSVLLGLIASVLLTGAFHEDGFADVCDGFGGGWTQAKILEIMKDSRVGTYGVTGLVLMLGLKTAITCELTGMAIRELVPLLIASHSLSRLMAASVICFSVYARANEDSKAKPVATGFSLQGLLIAAVLAFVPFALFLYQTHWIYTLALIPTSLVTVYLRRYFIRWIGGYTGDCLGATQQVSEVVFLLGMMAVWRSI